VLGQVTEGESHLERATQLNPQDQQAWCGLAKALDMNGKREAADQALIRVIEIDPRSPIADTAREQRTRYAHQAFRERAGGVPRMDAVMYLLGAIQKFEEMSRTRSSR